MARIRKEEALRWLAQRLPRLEEGECLDFLCKKRNRLVRIIRRESGYFIEERGFFKADFEEASASEVLKLAEKLLAREFPRSFMLWAHQRKA